LGCLTPLFIPWSNNVIIALSKEGIHLSLHDSKQLPSSIIIISFIVIVIILAIITVIIHHQHHHLHHEAWAFIYLKVQREG